MQELVFFIGESELVLKQEDMNGDVTVKEFNNSMDRQEASSIKISATEILALIQLYVQTKIDVCKSETNLA